MQSGVHWYGYEGAAAAEAGAPCLDQLDPLEYPMMVSTSALEEALLTVRSSWTSDVKQLEEMLQATEQRNEELSAELARLQKTCDEEQPRVAELHVELAQARASERQRAEEALESMRELEKLELALQKERRCSAELQAELDQLKGRHSQDVKELEQMLKMVLADNDTLQFKLREQEATLTAATKPSGGAAKQEGSSLKKSPQFSSPYGGGSNFSKRGELASPASTAKTTTPPYGGSPVTPTGSVLSHTTSGLLMSPRSTRSMKQPLEEPEAGGPFHLLLSQSDRGPTLSKYLLTK